MVADELHGDFAAALVRDVGHLLAGRLLDRDRDDLVFLLGAGAAHLELAVRRRLDRVDVFLRGLYGVSALTQRMNSSSAIIATGVSPSS